jgi:hypothetical protein
VLIVAVPMLYGGRIGVVFALQAHDPTALIVHAGLYDYLWWLSSVLVSAISCGFLTLAHQWPAMLAARSERMLRINSVFLPVYEIAIMLPVIIGFTGLLLLSNLGPTTWSRRGPSGAGCSLTTASWCSHWRWASYVPTVAGVAQMLAHATARPGRTADAQPKQPWTHLRRADDDDH